MDHALQEQFVLVLFKACMLIICQVIIVECWTPKLKDYPPDQRILPLLKAHLLVFSELTLLCSRHHALPASVNGVVSLCLDLRVALL